MYYIDLKHVWKIAPNGTKSMAVRKDDPSLPFAMRIGRLFGQQVGEIFHLENDNTTS